MSTDKFPKLPEQDEFLLYLINNSYSNKTVVNYARDLSIFALYLSSRGITFTELKKQDIDRFKGYLKAGMHISDLKKIRTTVDSRGTHLNEKKQASVFTDEIELHLTDRKKMSENDPLSIGFYSKVYANLLKGIDISPAVGRPSDSNDGAVKGTSINRMLSAFRSYIRYRYRYDLPIPFPPDAVMMTKVDRNVKTEIPTIQEIVQFIEYPLMFEKNYQYGLRNSTILEMLLATGMRISELVSLDLDQIDLSGKILVSGKGRKYRFVYCTDRSLRILDKYIYYRMLPIGGDIEKFLLDALSSENVINNSNESSQGDKFTGNSQVNIGDGSQNGNDSDIEFRNIKMLMEMRKKGLLDKSKLENRALFVSFNRKEMRRISTNYIQEKIVQYRKMLGIQHKLSAHKLRHAFATYLADRGASPTALQVLLGHSSLDTTTRYLHTSDIVAETEYREIMNDGDFKVA